MNMTTASIRMDGRPGRSKYCLNRDGHEVSSGTNETMNRRVGGTLMRFVAQFKAVCGQLFEGFVQARLMAELPDADERFQRRIGSSCDNPRSGAGPPIIGIL